MITEIVNAAITNGTPTMILTAVFSWVAFIILVVWLIRG